MKNLFILAIFALMGFLNQVHAAHANQSDVAGEWKYEVPQAPYGYQEGILILTETENKLEGEVKFSDGYKVSLKEISFQNGKLKFGLYIDYEYISVEADLTNAEMKGFVNSPEGKMGLTAKKVKK